MAEWPVSDDGDSSNCSFLRNGLIWSNKKLVPCMARPKEPFSLLKELVPFSPQVCRAVGGETRAAGGQLGRARRHRVGPQHKGPRGRTCTLAWAWDTLLAKRSGVRRSGEAAAPGVAHPGSVREDVCVCVWGGGPQLRGLRASTLPLCPQLCPHQGTRTDPSGGSMDGTAAGSGPLLPALGRL